MIRKAGKGPFRRSASVSLALCLMLPVILLLFNGILMAGRKSRGEVDLVRGTALTAESALAFFDRGLYSDFGLFGLDIASMEKAGSTLVGPGPDVVYRMTPDKPLSEPGVLRDGIARHMTLRSVTGIIADALDKLEGIRFLENKIDLSSLADLLPDLPRDPYRAVDPQLDYEEEPDWLSEYNQLMDDEVRAVYQEGLALLAPLSFPREDGSFENLDYDPFGGQGLDQLGRVLDRLLFVAPEGFLDRVILSEYSLSYFKNDVPFQLDGGERREDRTPDGRPISAFPDSRDREAEEIATGFTGSKAALTINMFIGSIRFVMHLIHSLTDQTKMTEFRTSAAGLSVLISVVSMGEVNISPELLTWILIISAPLIQASRDTIQLKKGHVQDLWPGNLPVNLPMRYRDYLRLLIVLQPPDLIASRISGVIGRVYPGPYYSGLLCQGEWEGVKVTHAASYLGRSGGKEGSE